jgi:hypothetical protein
LRKATLSFVLSVRPHGTTRFQMDWFSWNFIILRKSVDKIQVSFKSGNNNEYFTRRPVYIFDHISLNSSWHEKSFRQILHSRTDHRWQNGARALHAGYLRLQTHIHNM